MVKKVTLDTLDIEEGEIPLPERTVPAAEERGNKSPRRLTAKLLLISTLALVVLIVIAGGLYWWMGTNKTVARLPKKDVSPAAPLPAGPATVNVNDFIVTLQDDKGKYLVMTCDLTLELSPGQEVIVRQHIVEVRKIIYEILKQTKVVSPQEPKTRSGLKEAINKAVNGSLGQQAIQAIYFTKFVVR